MTNPAHPCRIHARALPLSAMIALVAASPGAAAPPARTASSPAIIALPLKLIIPPAQRTCTQRTASGLGYRVLRPAAGPRAAAGATVRVHYIGYFAATGEVFDQGRDAEFPVDRVIAGFGEGAALMPRGAIYRLCIPAALGYGNQDKGPIPAGSNLVFQVEMVDPAVVSVPSPAPAAR